jgi:hypothetical protein
MAGVGVERGTTVFADYFHGSIRQYAFRRRMPWIAHIGLEFEAGNIRGVFHFRERFWRPNFYPSSVGELKGVLCKFVGGIQRLPLLLGIRDVKASKNNDCYGCESSYASTVPIQEIHQPPNITSLSIDKTKNGRYVWA